MKKTNAVIKRYILWVASDKFSIDTVYQFTLYTGGSEDRFQNI